MINKAIFKRSSAFCALAVAGVLTAPTAGFAAEVTLKSSDGTVNIVGELQGFEENSYVVKTGLGELRISAERVRCEGEACPVFETASADVIIAGSDTVGLGMMPLLLEGFAGFLDAESTVTATSQEGELIAELIGDQGFGDPLGSYLVSSTASGDAFTKLLSKDTEIGMASRRIRPAEARALRDAGAGNMVSPDQEHIIAVDSLVVITHPDNPIQTLSMEQLGAIYTGNITNWSQLGGPDLAIKVIGRQEGSGTSDVFYGRVLGDSEDATLSSDIVVAENNNEAAAMVNNDPAAIGFVGYAFQRGAKALSLVNECGITMRPDAFSARTEEYALQRRLYLYNRADNLSEASEDFLQYALSESADGVIAKSGFIGLEIDQRAMTADSDRARILANPVDAFEAEVASEMLETMVNYDRLSTTFRFRTGSSQLDERGVKDMKRLTEYLENAPTGTKVMVVGFTDSVGAFASNRGLSERRAEQVLEDLKTYGGGRLDGIEMASTGYGEIAPSACNVSEDGRRINRRVEIWVTNQAG